MSEKEFNENKYKTQWKRENRDRISIEVPKGRREVIRSHAKAQGYNSINEYINMLINKDMESTAADAEQ